MTKFPDNHVKLLLGDTYRGVVVDTEERLSQSHMGYISVKIWLPQPKQHIFFTITTSTYRMFEENFGIRVMEHAQIHDMVVEVKVIIRELKHGGEHSVMNVALELKPWQEQ